MNTLNSSGKTSITIDGSTLLHGDYSVSNNDLIISTDSDTTLIKDYFVNLPILESPQGATLTPKLVSSLSAYNSNTLLGFEDPKAIGEITVTDGPIVITRLGQKIELNQGDFIYLNDLVDVGTMTVGITFKDDTALSLEPGAKMVVDEFYYDPEANQGGMNADVIGGSFSFVSGEIAKVGNDTMTVSTPVLTIGVRGTQVAGRANQEGEDNEIVLLPNQDGTVGEIAIKNDSGEVVLTQPYEATTITSSFVPPTVPVILPKEVVLKKYAKTISTTRKTEKVKEVERETEEATKEKEEAEEEKEELEEEAEELEEEAEELEEEKEELEEEAEELEEEKEELEEEAEALEEEKEELQEEAEALEEEKEELEEAKEELAEEKEEIQEKAEELKEEIAELEEQLAEADAAEAEEIIEELEEAQQEIEEVEEVQQEIEEKFEEVEEKFEEVVAEEKFIEQKVEQVEEKVEEVQQEVLQVEEKFEEVQQEVIQVEEKFEEVKQEVIQIEQKVEFVEEKIVMVEEKFDAIVQEFEVFQQEFVQEFEDYIPEEEIQQFIEEAPIELIEQFQEKVIQQLEEEQIEIQENIQEEPEDIFAEEAVQEKLAEIEEKQEELIEKADDLMQMDMELQEQAQELEEEQQALEEEAEALEEAAEEAYANNDRQAIEEIEEQYQELDRERQELNEGFEELNEQYEELDENFEELNNEFFAMDEELQEVFQDGPMIVRVPEDGPGYNQDDDVFNVPDEQVIDLNVEEFLAEEKAQALQNNDFAVEADNFFNDQEVQEALPDDIDQNVQDMMVIQAGDLNEYFVGAGAGINDVDDFYADDPMEDFYNVVDNNEVLYEAERDAQDFMDDLIENIAVEQNINVAPWLDMPNDVTVAEANAKVAGTVVGYVYGTDANGDTLTYSIFDDPTGALSISGNTIIWDGTYAGVSQDTTYSVILKVQDPYGASDVDSFNITVTADTNDPTAWVTAGDGSAGDYKQTIAYVGSSTDGRDFITTLGHSSVSFNGAIASNFNGYDVIVYYNQSNTSHSSSPFGYNDTRFIDWVDDGGVFVMYDRYVNDSANDSKIPGHNGNVVTTRDAGNTTESGSYQIVTESTVNLLKYGPGGIMVDDTSSYGSDTAGDHSGNNWLGTFNIGGGNSTNHGYMDNLDSDVLGLATRANTDQYVDVLWQYGAGAVYYSTTPLDHYIQASPATFTGAGNDAWDAYALNSLHFATSLKFDGYSQINGTAGTDKIFGTAGDDVFFSRDGNDTIWGGQGSDTFKYTQTWQTDPATYDTILDFNSSEDRIDISAITNGASISRTLDVTRFKIDSDNNGSYEMEWQLDDYTGTADDITVIT